MFAENSCICLLDICSCMQQQPSDSFIDLSFSNDQVKQQFADISRAVVFATVPDYFTRIVTSFYRRAFKAYLVVHRKHDQTSMTSVSISSFVCVVFHEYSLVNASWCGVLSTMCFINPQVSSQHYWDGGVHVQQVYTVVCVYMSCSGLFLFCSGACYPLVSMYVMVHEFWLQTCVNINALFRGDLARVLRKSTQWSCLFSMHGYLYTVKSH